MKGQVRGGFTESNQAAWPGSERSPGVTGLSPAPGMPPVPPGRRAARIGHRLPPKQLEAAWIKLQ
eukprot:742984-Hanusia_phi.AAC.1